MIFYQARKLPADKEAGLERSSKSLNEKLASVLLDSHGGDDPSAKVASNSHEEVRGILLLYLQFFSPTLMLLVL